MAWLTTSSATSAGLEVKRSQHVGMLREETSKFDFIINVNPHVWYTPVHLSYQQNASKTSRTSSSDSDHHLPYPSTGMS